MSDNKLRNSKIASRLSWGVAMFLAFLWLFVTLAPFFFMVLNSFKDKFEILVKGVFSMPESWHPTNYVEVLTGDFFHFFFNSLIVVALSLFLLLMISAFASYPLSRFNFTFRDPLYGLIIACMSIPIHITLIPVFKMTTNIGLYDSIWALIGPYVAFGIPISVFILTGFMKGIPREIEESAEIDGCNKYQNFFRMILPLSTPGLSTIAIYNSVNMWNEFSFAYTLTQNVENRTLPLAIWEFQGRFSMNTPMIMAVLTLTIMPMIIMFIIFQDKLVKGMTAGSVKG